MSILRSAMRAVMGQDRAWTIVVNRQRRFNAMVAALCLIMAGGSIAQGELARLAMDLLLAFGNAYFAFAPKWESGR